MDGVSQAHHPQLAAESPHNLSTVEDSLENRTGKGRASMQRRACVQWVACSSGDVQGALRASRRLNREIVGVRDLVKPCLRLGNQLPCVATLPSVL